MRIRKHHFILGFILILALVLRLQAAQNLDPNPDEMAYVIAPLNIIEAGKISTLLQSPLFSYLTDLGYQLFGFTTLTTRLAPIIFGTFSVLLIYLISMQIFNNRKASLIGSFLFAISSYGISENIEPDGTAYFFLLFSIYFFIKFHQQNQNRHLWISSILLALGVLSKVLVALAIPAYILFYLVHNKSLRQKKGKITLPKKEVKAWLGAAVIFLILVSPVLIHNYLSYTEKGVTDFYFSSILGIGENILPDSFGGQDSWSLSTFFAVLKDKISMFGKGDFVLLVMGLAGFLFGLKKKTTHLLLLIFGFVGLYLAGKTGSNSHYLVFITLFAIVSGMGAITLVNKWGKKVSQLSIGLLLILALIISLVTLNHFLFQGKSAAVNLREFSSGIPENAIVVTDPLIYTGITAWTFAGTNFVNGQNFIKIMNALEKIPEKKLQVPVYYVECGRNSKCGWKPEDYARVFDFSESLGSYFRDNLAPVRKIEGNDVLKFTVYVGQMEIVPGVYDIISDMQWHFHYPIGWKSQESAFDYYAPSDTGEKLLLGFGKIITYLNLLLALVSIILLLHIVIKEK